jgi:hypothetical protein
MDETETILYIKGYQHRVDDQREVLAPFVAAILNSNRQSKNAKRWKASDLFDRERKQKAQEQHMRRIEDEHSNVYELKNRRRRDMRRIKEDGPPKLPKKRT